ncbi:MAG: hypothetical protein F6K22_29285 [Okeania sp. SIO2F4]|uniref:hypothetical protein n=1 Tax=Okeania sp. SIO2F4 TaxID=2607790 RepID=UPI00142993E6|nr:hypothetical protein [Okeania sp. SIO2F4]NES06551.1 hypothetical protein [Okeania sp. SIO2F4]
MTADSLDISILLMASIIVDLIVYGLPDKQEEFFRVFFLYILLGFLYYPVIVDTTNTSESGYSVVVVLIFLQAFLVFISDNIIAVLSREKQAVNDIIARCLVIKGR